jgi:hypothetical protein
MTEDEARSEARRRNGAREKHGSRAGQLLWLPVEQDAGDWTVEECTVPEPRRRSRLAQAVGYLLEGL